MNPPSASMTQCILKLHLGGERTLLHGYVREPGHHEGLRGVQSVKVGPVLGGLQGELW